MTRLFSFGQFFRKRKDKLKKKSFFGLLNISLVTCNESKMGKMKKATYIKLKLGIWHDTILRNVSFIVQQSKISHANQTLSTDTVNCK